MRVLALSLLIFSGIGTTAFAQSDSSDLSGEEVKFYRMVNQFREILNLPTLTLQSGLQTAARNHSVWMQSQDYYLRSDQRSALNHNGPTEDITPFMRMKALGYTDFTIAGENISCGNGSALKTFQQFVFSPDHLENLVNSHFRDTGIAREGTGDERCPYYWTNDFASRLPMNKDQPEVTDIELIKQAIITVSGPIPQNKFVALPTPAPRTDDDSDDDTGPSPDTRVAGPSRPAPVQPSQPAQPVQPIQSSNSRLQQAFNQLNTGGMTVSTQIAPINSLQCVIPFATGKGLVTPYTNTDTLLLATKTSSNTYSVTLSYFLGKNLTSAAPIITNSVTITRNQSYPIVTLFVAPGSRLGGFMIQVNTQTYQSQFDSYGISPGVTGSVICTVN